MEPDEYDTRQGRTFEDSSGDPNNSGAKKAHEIRKTDVDQRIKEIQEEIRKQYKARDGWEKNDTNTSALDEIEDQELIEVEQSPAAVEQFEETEDIHQRADFPFEEGYGQRNDKLFKNLSNEDRQIQPHQFVEVEPSQTSQSNFGMETSRQQDRELNRMPISSFKESPIKKEYSSNSKEASIKKEPGKIIKQNVNEFQTVPEEAQENEPQQRIGTFAKLSQIRRNQQTKAQT